MFAQDTRWMRVKLLALLCGSTGIGAMVGCGDKEPSAEETVAAWEADGWIVDCFEKEGDSCPAEVENGCCMPNEDAAVELDGECCYPFDSACCGRPLSVDGRARVATARPRGDWADTAQVSAAGLAPEARAVLAAAWLEEALLEHASVASFARFTLDLMAAGAPPELLVDAQRAGLDEVAHARACFALAGDFGGEAVGPGPLSMQGVSPSGSLAQAAAAAVIEACVGETVAAVEARVRAERVADPAIRAALAQIAEDESRHAELGWRFVRWALAEGGAEVAAAVTAAFEQALSAPVSPAPDALPAEVLRAAGRLPAADCVALRAQIRREVLLPCRATLLAGMQGEVCRSSSPEPPATSAQMSSPT